MKPLTQKQLQKLENFIGYGRKNAKTIFLGLEEAGGGEKNLIARLNTKDYTLLDCRDFHLEMLNFDGKHRMHNYDHNFKVTLQRVWGYMSYLMLRLDGKEQNKVLKHDKQLLREYQNNLLGTKAKEGETLLAEIYPIPCKNMNSWIDKGKEIDYRIFPYKNKKDYQHQVFPKRQKIFKEYLNSEEFQAEIIICYGKSKWPKYKEFFAAFDVEFKPITHFTKPTCKAVTLGGTRIYLVPFLGNGQVSYDYLDELAEDSKRA